MLPISIAVPLLHPARGMGGATVAGVAPVRPGTPLHQTRKPSSGAHQPPERDVHHHARAGAYQPRPSGGVHLDPLVAVPERLKLLLRQRAMLGRRDRTATMSHRSGPMRNDVTLWRLARRCGKPRKSHKLHVPQVCVIAAASCAEDWPCGQSAAARHGGRLPDTAGGCKAWLAGARHGGQVQRRARAWAEPEVLTRRRGDAFVKKVS